MSQETLILVVRAIAIVLVLLIIWTIWRILQKTRHDDDSDHPRHRHSALDKGAPLPPNEYDDWDIQGTKPLNKGFFGKHTPPAVPDLENAPQIDLPLAIMARHGQHFTGEDIASLINTFGLQRSPVGTYELINENGRDILFSMLNIHAPGTFPNILSDMMPIDGILLVMQLPNGSHALKSFETFSAMGNEMCEHIDGRLCDFERRPIGPKELMLYRKAAENFQTEFNDWLAKQQSKQLA